jgi:hypothetical protein
MVRKRGRRRRSYGIKRAKRQRIKLDPRLVSIRFKERIEPMSADLSYWLNLLDQLEKEILPLLVQHKIPTEEFVNYLAYAKRLFSKVSRFRTLTLFNEILNWIAIFVTRGLKRNVLEALVEPIKAVWERQFVVVLDYLKYELTFGPAVKPNYSYPRFLNYVLNKREEISPTHLYKNFLSCILNKKEEIAPTYSYSKPLFYILKTTPAPIPLFPYKHFVNYFLDWFIPFKPYARYKDFISCNLAVGIPIIPAYEYKNLLSYNFAEVSPTDYRNFFSYRFTEVSPIDYRNFLSYKFTELSPIDYKNFLSYSFEKGLPLTPSFEARNFVTYSLLTGLGGS